jgi:biotin carboxyl carrier protein
MAELMKRVIQLGSNSHDVTLTHQVGGPALMSVDGIKTSVSLKSLGDDCFNVRFGDCKADVRLVAKGEDVFVQAFGRAFILRVLEPVEQAHEASGAGDLVTKAPMPGLVVELHVDEGEQVTEGQNLMTIESMKLLTVLKARCAGIVEKIHFAEEQTFNKNALLVSLQDLLEKERA